MSVTFAVSTPHNKQHIKFKGPSCHVLWRAESARWCGSAQSSKKRVSASTPCALFLFSLTSYMLCPVGQTDHTNGVWWITVQLQQIVFFFHVLNKGRKRQCSVSKRNITCASASVTAKECEINSTTLPHACKESNQRIENPLRNRGEALPPFSTKLWLRASPLHSPASRFALYILSLTQKVVPPRHEVLGTSKT